MLVRVACSPTHHRSGVLEGSCTVFQEPLTGGSVKSQKEYKNTLKHFSSGKCSLLAMPYGVAYRL